jgi:hypothetical protein
MTAANRETWAYLTNVLAPLPLGVGVRQQTGEYKRGQPLVADLYEDRETGQLVQICWEEKILRWSKRPSHPNELLSCNGLPWEPFPETPDDGRYPWRTDHSAS